MDGKIALYQKVNTLGKSQVDLILQVYDGAIGAFQNAADSFSKNDIPAGREKLEKARKFVTHLYTTLDMEKGGEVAEQLGKLYAFILNTTSLIDATKDLARIDDNVNILKNLRAGWVALKEQQTAPAKETIDSNSHVDFATLA